MKRNIETKLELCRKLEISRTTLDKYLTMPNAPTRGKKGYGLAAIAKFISENAVKESTASAGNAEIKSLRAREISLRCDRLQHRLARDRGEVIELATVANAMRRVLPRIPEILDQRLVQEAPSPEEKIRARKAIDEAVKQIRELSAEFQDIHQPKP